MPSVTSIAPPVSPPAGRSRTLPAVSAGVVGLLVGVMFTTALGILLGTGRLAGESQESKALTILRGDAASVQTVTRQVAAAPHVAELRTAGAKAKQTVEVLRDRDARLALLDDPAVAGPATRAHQAMIAILAGYGDLTEVSPKRLDAWDDGQTGVTDALGTLDSVSGSIQAFDLERPLRLDSGPPEAAAEHVATYLTLSARKLARYEKRLSAFRRKHRAKLKIGADYQTTVQMQIGAYSATRKELQDYINQVKADGERIPAFRSALQDARRKREGIRATLAALAAPTALAARHQALVTLLDKAISGSDLGVAVADAIEERRSDGDNDTDAFDLPEYDRFQAQSSLISNEYNASWGAWTTATDRYLGRLKGTKGGPKKPQI